MLINHTKSSLLYSKQNLITIQGTALLFLVMKTFKIYSLSNFRISNTAIWGGGALRSTKYFTGALDGTQALAGTGATAVTTPDP